MASIKSSNIDGFQMNFNYQQVVQLVDKYLENDTKYFQLHDLLNASSVNPTVTGLYDNDYPNLAEIALTIKSLTNLQTLKTIPLPSELTNQFSHAQQNCEMGLFTDINRAWLTIDSNIYLWTYDNGSDVAYYDGLTEPILGVGLIKPRKGVFKDYIKYLLCLTTSVEIVILGLTCNLENGEIVDLLLIPEPIFSLPTDNVIMSIIQGTDSGRIFLGGKDGCLYEIYYQATETWYSKKCKKINHSRSTFSFLLPTMFNFSSIDPIVQIEVDNSRNILYTRTENGTIDVYDLGSNGDQTYRCASKSLNSIAYTASQIVKTIDSKNFKPIVHIQPVENCESVYINLIAFTQSGFRLYLTTYNTMRSDSRPENLNLVHVRLPPGYTALSSSQRANNVHLAYHRRGNTLLVAAQNDGKDVLWTLNNDPFPFERQLSEVYCAIPIHNKIWKMTEEMRPQIVQQKNLVKIADSTKPVEFEPPTLITQEMEESRKYVFLTANGVHICNKPRPVDHFKQLLIDNRGYDNEAVKGFFLLYKENQACAIALTLACNTQSPQEKLLAEWAKLAFFKYGGESQIAYSNQNINSTHPVQISTPNQSMKMNQSIPPLASPITQSPIQPLQSLVALSPSYDRRRLPTSPSLQTSFANQTMNSPNFAMNQQQQQLISNQSTAQPVQNIEPSVQYSSKHNGLYLYFTRLVRPIWNFHVVRSQIVKIVNDNRECLLSSISVEEINIYLEKLSNLKDFLIKNIQFTNQDTNVNYTFMNQLPAQIFTAQTHEKTSFCNLLQLISRCLEVLGLWRLLNEGEFFKLAACLPKELQIQLKSMNFKDLVVQGNEICALLASALVQCCIEENQNTDVTCNKLNEVCPSIFKQENALLAKAHEIINKAKSCENKKDAEQMVEEAVSIFRNIGSRINLEQASILLESVRAFKEIVKLVVEISAARDKDNLALHYYRNGEPVEDNQGRSVYYMRCQTYKILLDVYERLVQKTKSLIQIKSQQQNTSSMNTSIFNLTSNLNSQPMESNNSNVLFDQLTQEQAKNYSEIVLNEVIANDDELLHCTFYDWFFEHQQKDTLLKIKSVHLENYLKKKAKQIDNFATYDLLWMYYEKNGDFRSAAQILSMLAEKYSTEIDLYRRIEYLSRAIVSMKSCQSNVSKSYHVKDADLVKTSGEFLHELEEKMDVGKIQLQILENLQKMQSNPSIENAISRLNVELLDISNLYEEYADRFDLPECKLAIIYSAGHYEPILVENLWEAIIEKKLAELYNKPESFVKLVLSDKIKSLFRIYQQSENYFPVEFVVRYLESKTRNPQTEPDWLVKTLLSLDFSLNYLLEIYHKLYQTKDPNANWPDKSSQLLNIIIFILNTFCRNPNILPPNHKKSFVTKCLDVIASYQIDLQSKGGNRTANSLISELKNIQNKLEKIL